MSDDKTQVEEPTCALLLNRPGFHGRYHRGHMRCIRAQRKFEAHERRNGWAKP